MKFCRATSLRAALAAGFLLASAGVLSAQDEDETPRQREACTPDVYRLCGQYIPNRKLITDCLNSISKSSSAIAAWSCKAS